MPIDYKRTDRIAEVMLRELSTTVQHDMKDPRIKGLISLSSVEVTHDLAHAKVYFSVYNAEPAQTATLLNGSSGYMRSILAKRMSLRTVPQLHFVYDESIEYGNRMSQLLNRLVETPDPDDVTDVE